MSSDVGAPATLGVGVLFVFAGTALLLQELDVVALRWNYLLPIIVVAVGVAVLISALWQAHRANGETPDR